MITIALHNSAGELDRRTVNPDEHANSWEAVAKAAVELIDDAGELYDGDKIIITDDEK